MEYFLINPSSSIERLRVGCVTKHKNTFEDVNGKFTIYNEDLGHWNEDDNWYSNHSYKPYTGLSKAKWLGWYEDEAEVLKTDVEEDIICEGCNELKDKLSFNAEYNIHICEDCKEWLMYEDKL